MLQPGQIQTLADVYKNKFMVQATSTELQSSENFKLQTFWEEQAQFKSDKTKLQQHILKINILSAGESRGTVVAPKQDGVISYENAPKKDSYEKAPTDEINTTQSGLSSDEQKLVKLEGTISGLQEEINKITRMHTEEGGNKEGLHDWQNEDKGEGGARYSMVTLIIAFVFSMGLGAFLVQ